MNGFWVKEGVNKLRDSIQAGEKIEVSGFFLAGASVLAELSDFTADYDTTAAGFVNKIFQGGIGYSYISEDSYLTVFCEVPADTEAQFYCNGIGIYYKNQMGEEFLLAVGEVPLQQHALGVNNSFEMKLPILSDAVDSIVTFEPGDRVTGAQMSAAVENHDSDPLSHSFLVENLSSVSDVLRLEKLYKDIRAYYEFFLSGWHLYNPVSVGVASAVAGDDSIDVVSTAELQQGEYVIFDDQNSEIIKITEVLTSQRVRVEAALQSAYGSSAKVAKVSLTGMASGEAIAEPGGVYISEKIRVGGRHAKKCVVIRREDNLSELAFSYRDDSGVWHDVEWEWKRDGGDIPAGYADYEYLIPEAMDDIYIKVVASSGSFKIKHIVCLGEETGIGGEHHAPEKPVNFYPASSATGIMEVPTLSISGYSSPVGARQSGVQFVLSDTADFSFVVYDSGEVSGLSSSVPAGLLSVSSTYYFKARVKDEYGAWSEWSDPSEFSTAAVFEYVATPVNTAPAAKAEDIRERPYLSSSAFSVINTTDTHELSRWQVRDSSGSYSSPVWDSGEVSDLTQIQLPAGILEEGGKGYFFRVQHKGTSLGWSEWSGETGFLTKDVFANIIGLAAVQQGGHSGSFKRVDKDGNFKDVDPAFFDNHAVYKNIAYTIIDGQDMMRIPKFYFKSGYAPENSDAAGKKSWWVSDVPAPGFQLHPAFLDEGVEIDCFYVGKYECVDDPGSTGVKAASLSGKSPLVSIDFPTMKNRCTARNTAGVEGFHLWDIHELGAVQMLCLVEVGSPDVQSVVGSGNVNSAGVVNTGGTDAVWRGIYELWGNVWHMTDGLQIDTANLLQLVNPESGVLENTTVTMSEADGWVTGFYDNFPAIFLPEAVTPATEDATYADNFWAPDLTEQNVCYHGGYWAYGLSSGLFSLHLGYVASYSGAGLGGRLAKK